MKRFSILLGALVVAGCAAERRGNVTPSAELAMVDSAAGMVDEVPTVRLNPEVGVFIASPNNGDRLLANVTVALTSRGVRVNPSSGGGMVAGARYHLLLDTVPPEIGQPVPPAAAHRIIDLAPTDSIHDFTGLRDGPHVVYVVLADENRVVLPVTRDTVRFSVSRDGVTGMDQPRAHQRGASPPVPPVVPGRRGGGR
jgi:hypothetical protein